jgi:pimeloyl-ACP methyl ester carboxylesterase
MVFISPDYRASTSWMGPKAEADLVQIIGLLRKKHQVRRTYLCGASMGGTSVLIFAALHPDLVDGVSSQNGTANMVEYQHFLDAIAISYGGDKKQKPDEYRNRSAELFPEKFTMPVSFTVGGRDSTVEPHSVRRLSQKLLQINKDILIIDRPAGGHITNYEDTEAALEFIIKASQAREREQTPTSGEAGGETRDSRK